jgi:antitoxin YefM
VTTGLTHDVDHLLAVRALSDVLAWRSPQQRLQLWSMTTVPLSEAKARLSEIADEVRRTHERVHITRNGREYVVLLAAEDLESLEATVELLADPEAQERLRRAEADVASGQVLEEHEVRALLAQRTQLPAE